MNGKPSLRPASGRVSSRRRRAGQAEPPLRRAMRGFRRCPAVPRSRREPGAAWRRRAAREVRASAATRATRWSRRRSIRPTGTAGRGRLAPAPGSTRCPARTRDWPGGARRRRRSSPAPCACCHAGHAAHGWAHPRQREAGSSPRRGLSRPADAGPRCRSPPRPRPIRCDAIWRLTGKFVLRGEPRSKIMHRRGWCNCPGGQARTGGPDVAPRSVSRPNRPAQGRGRRPSCRHALGRPAELQLPVFAAGSSQPEARAPVPAQACAGARARRGPCGIGNARNESVHMGSFVNHTQRVEARSSLAHLAQQAGRLFDGAAAPLVVADPAVACCIRLPLPGVKDADAVDRIHDTAVVGPFARLVPHRSAAPGRDRARRQPSARARDLARRGRASHQSRQRDAGVAAWRAVRHRRW